tara:strand:+ start:21 stop:782 length:762 start_codon:yes stop_codon:yes gene_type:complete
MKKEIKISPEEAIRLYTKVEIYQNAIYSLLEDVFCQDEPISPTNLYRNFDFTNDTVFLDLGAYKGREIETLTSDPFPKNIQIYSFEPHPVFFKDLKEKYGDKSNVHLYQTAVSFTNHKGLLFFKGSEGINAKNAGASLCIHKIDEAYDTPRDKAESESSKITVDCVDIAELMNALNCEIDFLKLNVEGLEYSLIDRLLNTGLISKVKNILLSDHTGCFANLDHLELTLEALIKLKRACKSLDLNVYIWDETHL